MTSAATGMARSLMGAHVSKMSVYSHPLCQWQNALREDNLSVSVQTEPQFRSLNCPGS